VSRLTDDRLPNERPDDSAARPASSHTPRIAVISPFLDKSHGTERMVIEWVERLADCFEIHIFSQEVSQLDLSKFVIHHIPKIPGPHLLNYLWWYTANQWWRRVARWKGMEFDLVYSPGINCPDADAITVHIVFAEFVRRVADDLRFSRNRIALWPRLIHRKLYYRTIMALERRVFSDPNTQIILTAPQTAAEIRSFFGRDEKFPVLPPGIDHTAFNSAKRQDLRESARKTLNLADGQFTLLLIGNDWRKKGLGTLLESLRQLDDLPVSLLVVGRDDPGPFLSEIRATALDGRVRFLPPRADVESYYAAADAYVGPSLEDTFALPASEAMSCGLPVIISARAGAAAIVKDGVDALVLDDPTDSAKLAALIRSLHGSAELRASLGRNAEATVAQYTWERSAQVLAAVFQEILLRKGLSRAAAPSGEFSQ
jgi:glycosyltransferase involved in cell wall biosynthesis